MNKGRAVEGGTHQSGLNKALEQLRKAVFSTSNGVICVLSIEYPNVQWEGCIKGRIASPELETLVQEAIIERAGIWLQDHPEVMEQVAVIQTFQFPDAWFR